MSAELLDQGSTNCKVLTQHTCGHNAPTLYKHLSTDSAWDVLNTSSKIQVLIGQYCPNSYFTTSFCLGVPSTKLPQHLIKHYTATLSGGGVKVLAPNIPNLNTRWR
jgi:hypothetical protein